MRSLGLVLGGIKEGHCSFGGLEPEYLLEIGPPDKCPNDINGQVGGLRVVLPGDVAVGHAPQQGERLEWEYGHHNTLEVGADSVDGRNHDHSNQNIALQ